MNITAIVQARLGSTRFPAKVIQPVNGIPMIEILLKRLQRSKKLSKIVVATTDRTEDLRLKSLVEHLGFSVYQGSEQDVLDRFYQAVVIEQPDIVVRITGDCPFVDGDLVDAVIQQLIDSNADYSSNTQPATYPDGLDVEAFTFQTLQKSWEQSVDKYDREHVTPYMYRTPGKFKTIILKSDRDYSALRWTVDEKADFRVVTNVLKELDYRTDFSWKDVIELYQIKPDLFMHNQEIKRNEGAVLGTGQKLWKRAKTLIPGGNMLLSKRSEMFLPEYWPSYFSKAKGCEVWDMDDTRFTDMCIMGIGTNTLGYGHPEVDEAVSAVIKNGNMSTLNCPEEVFLAERLIELHPWADMARFTRSGGEANAVAIRIARAASGKDGVAICGYHGWHDWYLSANLGSDKTLNGHLMPGLEPNGVPQSLAGTVFAFNYNHIEELEQLVANQDIGVIFMEVMRNHLPENDFLQKVRNIATEKGIVLVFDECTSGFRETYGGLHLKYGVEPDMAMFGKALGNGYAINAIIGRRNVMEAAQTTFISSTFWTERIGPAAALKVLDVMKDTRSWETITAIGNQVSQKWITLSEKYDILLSVTGLPAITSFSFSGENSLKYKTYVTQEMLKNGILASNAFYACTEHTDAHLDNYFTILEDIFSFISQHRDDVGSFLEGPVCHSGFKRLN